MQNKEIKTVIEVNDSKIGQNYMFIGNIHLSATPQLAYLLIFYLYVGCGMTLLAAASLSHY